MPACRNITDLVGHSGAAVTETVYRHEIQLALTENGAGREPHPEGERHRADLPPLRESH
jgi:hypothetical protein